MRAQGSDARGRHHSGRRFEALTHDKTKTWKSVGAAEAGSRLRLRPLTPVSRSERLPYSGPCYSRVRPLPSPIPYIVCWGRFDPRISCVLWDSTPGGGWTQGPFTPNVSVSVTLVQHYVTSVIHGCVCVHTQRFTQNTGKNETCSIFQWQRCGYTDSA